MKRMLLTLGVVLMITCVVALLYAFFNMFAYYRVLDGSSELYNRLHRTMMISFIVSGICGVIGLICLIARNK